jgi:hypothetical protein
MTASLCWSNNVSSQVHTVQLHTGAKLLCAGHLLVIIFLPSFLLVQSKLLYLSCESPIGAEQYCHHLSCESPISAEQNWYNLTCGSPVGAEEYCHHLSCESPNSAEQNYYHLSCEFPIGAEQNCYHLSCEPPIGAAQNCYNLSCEFPIGAEQNCYHLSYEPPIGAEQNCPRNSNTSSSYWCTTFTPGHFLVIVFLVSFLMVQSKIVPRKATCLIFRMTTQNWFRGVPDQWAKLKSEPYCLQLVIICIFLAL